MAVQRRHTMALSLIALLLPYFILSMSMTAWATSMKAFDHISNPHTSETAKATVHGVVAAGARYQYSAECDFPFPSRHSSINAANTAAASAVRTISEAFASQNDYCGHSNSALVRVGNAFGGCGSSVADSISEMLQNLSPPPNAPTKERVPLIDLDSLRERIGNCYNDQGQHGGGRTSCLASIEAFFTPVFKWTKTSVSLQLFPLAVTYTILYPVAAYLAELKRHSGHQVYGEEVQRVKSKAEKIVSAFNDNILEAALENLFPQPLINGQNALDDDGNVQGYNRTVRMSAIREFAAGGLHSSTLVSSLKDYHWRTVSESSQMVCMPASHTFSQKYDNGKGRGDRGDKVVTGSCQFSDDNKCVLVCPHSCRNEAQAADATLTGPSSDANKPCVDLAVFTVMQALVEQSYAQGAHWAKEHIVDVVNNMEKAYTTFRELVA